MINRSQRLVRAVLATLSIATAAVTTMAAERPQPTPPVEERAVAPVGSDAWRQLEASHWIADGRTGARVVYVFTDLNCPYCNKLWSDARPWVNSGKVQLRHVIVGILTATSPGKAAALLADKEPAAKFAAYESQNAFSTATALASGRPHPLADGTLKPLASIAPAQQAQLAVNEHLMASLRLQATPGIVWRDEQGVLHARQGLPEGGLATLLGPP
jgi:thiol:disulfide interchange protein DsbG